MINWQKRQLPHTSIPNQSDSWTALSCLKAFPALVRKTVGTLNFPFLSTSLWNACGANGSTFLPRTITPSISNRSPKLIPCLTKSEETLMLNISNYFTHQIKISHFITCALELNRRLAVPPHNPPPPTSRLRTIPVNHSIDAGTDFFQCRSAIFIYSLNTLNFAT